MEATVQEQPRKRGRPTNEEVAAREAAAAPQVQVPEGVNLADLVLALAKQVASLQDQVAAKEAAKVPDKPNSARKHRRHIMVMVKPGTEVRVEVPDDYAGPGRTGEQLEGRVVKGYINHENTTLFR